MTVIPLMYNVLKRQTLFKDLAAFAVILKVCLTIMGYYTLKN